ncbi:copper amine oxidase N-terminal domain-containing protein [Cohnella hongkongensis]|uniref:Copper amine oxidase N-terminal domain-containing protein n=1 Tax=Cohnella hongkongensis TaxID=178337 RepID=A0ABV9F6I3_9BACL
MNKRLICMRIVALAAAIFAPSAVAGPPVQAVEANPVQIAVDNGKVAYPVQVVVDGEKVVFPDEPPYVDRQTHRTMVPARLVSEKLGAKMQWEGELNRVTFSLKAATIRLTIGQNDAQVNGKTIAIDAPAVIKNNRTMIPLRLIGELFQAQVEWDAKRQLAVVTSSPTIPKGTWIWDSRIIEQDRERILSFASEHDVTAVYLHVNKDIASRAYADFIRSAKERQIRVEALAGRPEWGLKANQNQIQAFMAWVRQYNASVEPEERFDGLHLDIEPYLLDEWETDRRKMVEEWIHNLRFLEQETRGSGLTIALDVPFWLHNVKIPGTEYSFSAWLLEKFDGLVIMDYRNRALGSNGIVENARAMLREAAALGKPLIVAIETAESSEGDHTSFYSKSAEYMEQELQAAHQAFSRYAGYAGMAVHDYRSWAALVGR